jgi:hypothetical protein
MLADEQDLFEMANAWPKDTGLPMTVWFSPKGGARHDARIKVNMTHGPSMDINNTAVVGIRPKSRLIHGSLSSADLAAVQQWITLNEAALIEHWEGRISSGEVFARMVKV